MKIETPPAWWEEIRDMTPETIARATSREVRSFVQHANEKYLPWDKVRRIPIPKDTTARFVWAAIQLSRSMQRQNLPISSLTKETKFHFWIPPSHLQWLHKVDQRGGGVIGTQHGHLFPTDDEYYLVNSLMEEAIASSQLEGASTTRDRAKKMLRANRPPRDKSEQMIVNNYRTIMEIRECKNDLMTSEMLCHFQESLTRNTLDTPDAAGRFRHFNEDVYIEDSRTNEVIYVPPPADTVSWRIEEICAFANANTSPFIHPVIKACVLHFAVGYVHPFVDGNGRTARALFYWYMLRSGYWLFEFLPISRVLIKAPAKYARAYLYSEAEGDVTYFTHYHLRAIDQAIQNLHEYIALQQRKLKEASQLLAEYPGLNYRQTSVIQRALKRANVSFTIREHMGEHRVTYATAHADLTRLAEMGFLRKSKATKQIVFYPVDGLLSRLKIPQSATVKIKTPPSVAVTRKKIKEPTLFPIDDSTTVAL